MQVLLVFISRFIGKENEEESTGQSMEERYKLTRLVNFGGDTSDFFIKEVDLPCVPQAGELYWLNFNPYFQSKTSEGFNHYRIEESGHFEDHTGIHRHYALWSEYEYEVEYNEEKSEEGETWEDFVVSRSTYLRKSFESAGWRLDTTNVLPG